MDSLWYTQWMVHWKVSEFCSHCRQENRGERTPQPVLSNTQQHMDGLPLAVLFVDPVVYFQSMLDSSSIFSKRHRVHMCATHIHRYAWHAQLDIHTDTHASEHFRLRRESCGMVAIHKYWSDLGHPSFLKWNVSYNCVYFMRLGEAHHCESHHSERINTVFAEALVPVYKRLNFLTAWKLFIVSHLSHSRKFE